VDARIGDVSDARAAASAAGDCDVVFHVAAKAGIWGSYDDYHRTNVIGSKNIIEACNEHRIEKLVYTSSPSVVFAGGDMEGVDESVPYASAFKAHYPKTKAAAEKLVLEAHSPMLATVALRPHLIWGPGDNHLTPRLIERGRSGRLCRVGRKPHLVDSIYIDNAAQAHLLAADRLEPGSPISGKAYFISQGEPMDIGELMNRIIAAAGLPPIDRTISPAIAYASGFLLEMLYSALGKREEPPMTRFLAKQLSTAHWFDISAARRDLDYDPAVSIEEGLERLRQSLQ
jgi:nucleoside-diphosphate-sugar epimerase